MGKYFGTDGFRGEANVTLTAEHALKIGKIQQFEIDWDKDQNSLWITANDNHLLLHLRSEGGVSE